MEGRREEHGEPRSTLDFAKVKLRRSTLCLEHSRSSASLNQADMAPRPQGQSLVPPTADDLRKFIQQLSLLVQQEQTTEELESALLFTNCSFQLLEAKGLALGNLAGGKTTIGLGGKTLVELERPLAYHTSPVFPPHGFRPGDLVALVDHAAGGKAKKGSAAKEADANGIEGVVWKVLETKIVVALGRGGARGAGAGAGEKGKADEGAKGEDLEIPERIRMCGRSAPLPGTS